MTQRKSKGPGSREGLSEHLHWQQDTHHLTRADRDFLTELATRKIGHDRQKMADFRRWLSNRHTTKGMAARVCKAWGEEFPGILK